MDDGAERRRADRPTGDAGSPRPGGGGGRAGAAVAAAGHRGCAPVVGRRLGARPTTASRDRRAHAVRPQPAPAGFSTGDPTSPARDDPDPRYKPTVLRDDRANAPGQDLAGVVHEAPKHDLLSKTEDYYSPAEAAQLLAQPQASIAVWRHQEVGRPT